MKSQSQEAAEVAESLVSSVSHNIAQIRERIAAAARRAARNPDDVELMAVTKTVACEQIAQAYDAGVRLFGENRVQEFEAKNCQIRDLAGARFHMIGHLQRNKSARAVALFHAIDSVDSWRIASALNDQIAERPSTPLERPGASGPSLPLPVLLEINVGGEEQKAGMAPNSEELERLLAGAAELPNLQLQGFMTVPPLTEHPEGSRPYFRRLRELRDAIAQRNVLGISMGVLSMGMSHDFEVAIEEGATRVRIGTAIFGEREK